MQLSFQMLPEQPASELLDAVALADELGYHGCYSADEIYHKDAWLLFAAAAQRTEQIRLGPCVARSTCGSRPTSLSSQPRSTS
jgi:5,10-methylenetetrahydromethanopterin reductase